MTTKLLLYNSALTEIGEREIASLAENREPRRVLDNVYDAVLAECLEAGQWNFAIRTVSVDSDPGLTTEFGFAKVFVKPDDWVRTTALAADARFVTPLDDTQYKDETAYWLADMDPLFVRYVSDDTDFGLDLSRWPASFAKYVHLSLAEAIVKRITSNTTDKQMLGRMVVMARRTALNKDAMNEGVKFLPMGSWAAARAGRMNNCTRRDRDYTP